jgi:hypothetical protein
VGLLGIDWERSGESVHGTTHWAARFVSGHEFHYRNLTDLGNADPANEAIGRESLSTKRIKQPP